MARFYISSTSEDLERFRAAAYKTLRQLGHDAIAMEDYVSSSSRPLTKCLQDVDGADVYIGIVAWRRGYVPQEQNPERLSMVELEYGQASKKNMPRLMFLLSPAAPWPRRLKDDPHPDRVAATRSVEDFRKEVCANHVVSFFETPDQLSTLLSIAVRRWEIENGIGTAVPALEDMDMPEGMRVKSYLEGKHLTVKYRLPFLGAVFVSMVAAVWLGLVVGTTLLTLLGMAGFEVAPARVDADYAELWIMIPFSGLGIWLFTRPKRIKFDFESGKVTVWGPGSVGKAAPQVGSLVLRLEKSRKGWRSRMLYNGLEFARSEWFREKTMARAHLLPFATALNYRLGFHSLEVTEGTRWLAGRA